MQIGLNAIPAPSPTGTGLPSVSVIVDPLIDLILPAERVPEGVEATAALPRLSTTYDAEGRQRRALSALRWRITAAPGSRAAAAVR